MTAQVQEKHWPQDGIKRSVLPAWQNWLVTGITLTYLICELAFNSRLLDLVGSVSTADEVHNMERYGRTLTAIAAALLALQFSLMGLVRLKKKGVWLTAKASTALVLLICLITGTLTWHAVEWVIERQVTKSTGEFRQMSLLAQLYQHALIEGQQTLEGIPLDSGGGQAQTWTSPSGKAFLATLPVLLSSSDRYRKLLERDAEQNLRDNISAREGGVRGYYELWLQARGEVHKQFVAYYNDEMDISETVRLEQARAWQRYERSLEAKRLKTWNVPRRYYATVRKQVRGQGVPVTNDWSPSDRTGFNAAVAKAARQKYLAQRTVVYKGVTLPKRLDWGVFFRLEVIQKELREKLLLPANTFVREEYPLNDKLKQFALELHTPHLNEAVKQQLPELRAAVSSYSAGGSNEKLGEDAARAVIVPPIALIFSLVGALTHLAKLLYLVLVPLTATLLTRRPSRPVRFLNRYPLAFPVALIAVLVVTFSLINNSITESVAYKNLKDGLAGAKITITDEPIPLSGGAVLRVMHAVSIGQSYSYPINQYLREHVLQGFDFGYVTREK
ncbi:hypothetical protein R4I72_09360 [Leclercia adecarboxylata]|jgi:hypothetical protein|uniref:hypothetical protein n=1 Tax=Leclercia TaxID=83654 RepID=UPI000CDCC389|nr:MULTISPECIES: hypothetical protein [Leclercia]POW73407.1 hypothetical protein C3373_02870 [Leclercia sp. LSNIH4]AUY38071.1 hypothetical protein C3F35_04385 [Leclercia sp. LSNIH3]MDQ2128652.1 hypothetical protein [Leclercia adecarboxylata]MDV7057265.1 hypothetical protein [Leclercia adecarboxylata]QIG32449.1 hypothetical protein FY047_07025 [Leclercia adecarboxylata]